MVVHDSAIIEDHVKIGVGTNVWHHAHIRSGAWVGRNCNIGKGVYIDVDVHVGDNCKIQNYACLYNGVVLGDDVFIGPHVCFTNDMYPRSWIWNSQKIKKTVVKRGVSIGANTTVVAGVKIMPFALIGAGCVVTKDVPAFSLFIGNPGRVVGRVDEKGRVRQRYPL